MGSFSEPREDVASLLDIERGALALLNDCLWEKGKGGALLKQGKRC